MLRGIGIEFRSHLGDSLWAAAFDFIFSVSSVLLATFFGAALGNVVRGVSTQTAISLGRFGLTFASALTTAASIGTQY
jgi:cytochrome bd-type quinol oxidase subunit 2